MTEIGYACVSTQDQSLNGQIDILEEYGCERIFSKKASGRKTKRMELDKCLDYLREGDILVIYKLDRLGRTTKQLIELSQWLDENGIDLHIIDMNVSTKDAMGKMFFTMMSAFAELEANLLSERTKKGLEAARARGQKVVDHHYQITKSVRLNSYKTSRSSQVKRLLKKQGSVEVLSI